MSEVIRVAIQKSGKLTEKSLELFKHCGIDFESIKGRLLLKCENFPIELMMVRSSDIPEYVMDGVCQLGVLGSNVIEEKIGPLGNDNPLEVVKKLGYGRCRLSLAVPKNAEYKDLSYFNMGKIATSYPKTLRRFLNSQNLEADVIEISGSVEIAPSLQIADGICDLVSTGTTLFSNNLREAYEILSSEAVLIRSKRELNPCQEKTVSRFLQRVSGVLTARSRKYIMMNALRSNLDKIKSVLPGMEGPSIMDISNGGDKIAIHAVCREPIFWETMENLKEAGASSILVLPIEKIID